MFNPSKKIATSKGLDLPILYVYLAGRIAGNCIEECLEWRRKIVNFYSDYKGRGAYPISFLDALNSKEFDSVDKLGLTSAIPPNLIYDKDMLSVKKADVVVANLEDYMEVGMYKLQATTMDSKDDLIKKNIALRKMIENRRPNYGTTMELSWALWLEKPTIIIAGTKKRKEILEKHPFTKRASVIVENVDELIEKKWLNILYKSISGATYE
jgi:nucleoside 2-deoxyribosyltransferase